MRQKRILLIGPVYPYRGGIAHHTALLCRALRKQYDVKLVSFSFQYPRLLYKREQKDEKNDVLRIPDAQYWLHTLNPLNWLKVARRIKQWKPDLLLIQWWHPYFAPCYWALLRAVGKGIRKVLICHNVFPHERFPLDRRLTQMALRRANGYIVHAEQEAADLKTIVAEPRYQLCMLPAFSFFRTEAWTAKSAREALGIPPNARTLLFFGFVREYKGLKHLLAAMPQILKLLPDAKLLVAGEFEGSRQEYERLVKAHGIAGSVIVKDQYIPDDEVEKYFAACDLVVLPYESATQSGIVQIAYGFDRPVVATDAGGLPEVVLHEKTGFIVPPRDPQALGSAVIRYFLEGRREEFACAIRAEKDRYSWDRLVEKVSLFLND